MWGGGGGGDGEGHVFGPLCTRCITHNQRAMFECEMFSDHNSSPRLSLTLQQRGCRLHRAFQEKQEEVSGASLPKT